MVRIVVHLSGHPIVEGCGQEWHTQKV